MGFQPGDRFDSQSQDPEGYATPPVLGTFKGSALASWTDGEEECKLLFFKCHWSRSQGTIFQGNGS